MSAPLDLFIDMAITMEKLSDKFNCNDGQLEDYDLEWWYFHKLNRRVQYVMEKLSTVKEVYIKSHPVLVDTLKQEGITDEEDIRTIIEEYLEPFQEDRERFGMWLDTMEDWVEEFK